MLRVPCIPAVVAVFRCLGICLALVAETCFAAETTAASTSGEDLAFFEQHVRPLLVKHCYECHAADSKTLQGSLRLDSRPGWERGGDSGPAVVPGKPDDSLLVRAVRYRDETLEMPPAGKLPAADIAIFEQWVARGAPDPRLSEAPATSIKKPIDIAAGRQHWAFQPLGKSSPPTVRDDRWCRTAVDQYIAAQLDQQHLQPNPSADRRKLIRRATFDLLGLPPTPAEVAEFVNDTASDDDAYARLIDRLLNSPHYGERWGRHWLDLARWGESHGFEQDYDRPWAYHYRDFVIRALNDDLPYNTFIRWQIAGDEYDPNNPLAWAATGFLGAGVHATQITANQAEKERYDELDDIVRTIGTSVLGLTIGCARCHDHKYDPIPTDDYYRLAATFTTTVRSNQFVNQDPAGYQTALARHQAAARPAIEARERYEREILAPSFSRWLDDDLLDTSEPRWVVLEPSSAQPSSCSSIAADGSIFRGLLNQLGNDERTITASVDATGLRAVRLEALTDERLPNGGPGLGDEGGFRLGELKLDVSSVDGKQKQTIKFRTAWASHADGSSAAAAVIDGKPNSDWSVKKPGQRAQQLVLEAEEPFGFGERTKLQFKLTSPGADSGIGRLRLSVSRDLLPAQGRGRAISQSASEALRKRQSNPESPLTDAERTALFGFYCSLDSEWRRLDREVQAIDERRPWPNLQRVMVCREGLPAIRLHTQGPDFYEQTHLLTRGDPNLKRGPATPGFLRVLVDPAKSTAPWQVEKPADARTPYQRRALAEWLTDADQGAGTLAARVIVNRLWHYHFGRGLVATPSDFGLQGAKPTHAELLDYLAGELIRGGWRLKPLHKLLMTSSVYRQTAAVDDARLKLDHENRWFWHRSVDRLEAEILRDSMLATSGELDARQFGPGTLDPTQRRRSIYFFVKRSKLIPMLQQFDAPDTLQDLAVRSTTTVAPQALLLVNSPIVRGYAEAFVGRLLAAEPAIEWSSSSSEALAAVVRNAYETALSRPPRADELQAATEFIREQVTAYHADQKPTPERLALADFCQVLFELNEFAYVD